jgi:vacuolar iron transporter family protein
MRLSYKKGFSFGLTSGIITTLGLMVGLYASTSSKMVVLGGILTIAVADSLSDALGIHMSEESVRENTHKQVWESTIAAFLTKFLFALTFVIPVLFLELQVAVIVAIVWGLASLIFINYFIAKDKGEKFWVLALEHVSIAALVIVATYFIGKLVNIIF